MYINRWFDSDLKKYQVQDILDRNVICEGLIDDVIRSLQKSKTHYSKSDTFYNSFRIRQVQKEYEDGYDIALIGIRDENELEIKDREEQDKRNAEYRRLEFERLKKEFGNDK